MIDISVCCTCYNHEKYISQALESILAQKGNFTIEILVHDDASSDRSQSIIKSYADKFPGIVKPMLQKENQYIKGIPINETFNFARAEGEYIALCEGDDFWIDEYKLAKQLKYMREHKNCSFCFSNAKIHDMNGQRPDRLFVPYYENEKKFIKPSGEYSLSDIIKLSFIPTASFMFRRSDYLRLKDELIKPFPYGDMRYKLLFTSLGYACFLNEATCVYRENVNGSAMHVWKNENRQKCFERLYSIYSFLNDLKYISGHEHDDAISMEQSKHINYAMEYMYSFKNLKLDGVWNEFCKKSFIAKLKLYAKIILGGILQ